MDIGPARVAQHGGVALRLRQRPPALEPRRRNGAGEVDLGQRRVPPCGGGLAIEERQQRGTVHRRRGLGAEPVQDRRRDIDRLGDGLDRARAGAMRVADQKRDVMGGPEDALLAPHPLIAQHLAVVGGQHHERAVGLPGRVEPVEQAPDVVIDLGQKAQIDGAQRLRGLGRHRRAIAVETVEQLAVGRLAEPCGTERVLRPARHRRRQGGGIHEAVVGRGRHQGRVGADVGDMGHPGPVAADVQRLQHPVGQIGRVAVLGAIERGAVDPAVLTGIEIVQPVGHRLRHRIAAPLQCRGPFQPRVAAHLAQLAPAGRHALVAGKVGVGGGQAGRVGGRIGIAEQQRLAPQPPQRQPQPVMVRGQRRAVADGAVVEGV